MAKEGGFLQNAYAVEDAEATHKLYEDWAESYEAEVRANGYMTPERCAEALARFARDGEGPAGLERPLLDLGCGTGLSGEAFRAAGFKVIDGTDFSQAMLDVAAKKPGVYRHLTLGDLNNPIPARPGDYGQIAAVGVFSPSHAPPEMIPTVMDLLEPGGLFVFSLNDHALEDPGYDATIEDLAARPAGEQGAEVLFREYGEHLPKADLKAVVCVLRRC